jgi:L-lysine 2,3-aminomutase
MLYEQTAHSTNSRLDREGISLKPSKMVAFKELVTLKAITPLAALRLWTKPAITPPSRLRQRLRRASDHKPSVALVKEGTASESSSAW